MERFFFRQQNRITTSKQFGFLFAKAKRLHCGRFSFYVLANNVEIARLGIIVAKKNQKKAVHRNRVKRIIRECFREKQQALTGLDLVIMLRQGVDKIPAVDLRKELCAKMEKIRAC